MNFIDTFYNQNRNLPRPAPAIARISFRMSNYWCLRGDDHAAVAAMNAWLDGEIGSGEG